MCLGQGYSTVQRPVLNVVHDIEHSKCNLSLFLSLPPFAITKRTRLAKKGTFQSNRLQRQDKTKGNFDEKTNLS